MITNLVVLVLVLRIH